MQQMNTVIVDPGYEYVRLGFMHSLEEPPEKRLKYKSLFGSPLRKLEHRNLGPARLISERRDYAIGGAAELCKGVLDTCMTVQYGHVENWPAFRHIVLDRFEYLSETKSDKSSALSAFAMDECSLIICEPCTARRKEREEMISFVFEYFCPKQFCPLSNAYCWHYKSGYDPTLRLCLKGGDDFAQFVNFTNSYIDRRSVKEVRDNVKEKVKNLMSAYQIHEFTYDEDETQGHNPWAIWDGANRIANDIHDMQGHSGLWITFDDYLEEGPGIINFCIL